MFSAGNFFFFWGGNIGYITLTMGKELKISEDNIILNYIPNIWGLTTGQHTWSFSFLKSAKRLILIHWKGKNMASFHQWINDMTTIASHEQIASRRRLCMDRFSGIWDIFIKTIKTHEFEGNNKFIHFHILFCK